MSRPPKSFMGIDDGPFASDWRGDVALVGTTYVNTRLDGIVTSKIRRDGRNSTEQMAKLVLESRFDPKLVFLQGIAVGGFNVVDLHELHARLERPVLVVARKRPNLRRIKRALLEKVPGGARKWALIEKAGPMEAAAGVFVQRAGLTLKEAERALKATIVHGSIPEPLRVAHLVAGAYVLGHSRGGA